MHFSEVGVRQFAIDSDGGSSSSIHTNVDVHMAAPQAVAQHAADFRLERFEAFGQSQMQIEKTMVYAAQAHAQGPAVMFEARFGKTRHGLQRGAFRRFPANSCGRPENS